MRNNKLRHLIITDFVPQHEYSANINSSLGILDYSNFTNKEFSLVNLERIFGGASRETYRIKVKDNSDNEEKLILRLSQDSSLIETEQRTEYLAYSAFQDSKVPVPTTES
mgnify:CR=1 FL=1